MPRRSALDKQLASRPVLRVRAGPGGGASSPDEDVVAVEEPLEIRVAGDPVAVTMRTPGDDARLAVGFLFGEGILRSIDDVGAVVLVDLGLQVVTTGEQLFVLGGEVGDDLVHA